jgi:uncharacterized membrane protein YeiH
MTYETLNYIISMTGTVAFAITAVLDIREENDIDVFGAIVLGLITAVGGGTMRDIILGVPVFWSTQLDYIWLATFSSFLALYGRKLFAAPKMYRFMLYLDGLGAATFGILAAGKVWDLGFGLPAAPVILGVLTAIGGGLIRDVLAGRTTLLMRPELYAVPVMLGCTSFVIILEYFPEHRVMAEVLSILGIFSIRVASLYWKITMPMFARTG